MLVAFGDDANFVVSVGGFHPRSTRRRCRSPRRGGSRSTSSTQPIARSSASRATSRSPRTRCSSARASTLLLRLRRLRTSKGTSPSTRCSSSRRFYFIIEISASVSVKVFGMRAVQHPICGSSSTGPTPWRAKGTGSISFLFFDIDVDFDITWGEARETTLPPIPVMPLLQGRVRQAGELARAAAGRGQPARLAARARRRPKTRWCSIRSACCASASGRCRST